MDLIKEFLPLLVIVTLSLLSQFFNNKKDEEDAPTLPDEAERLERQRRIQEEVRRQIAERQKSRQALGNPAPAPANSRQQHPAQPAQTTGHKKELYDPFAPDQKQRSPYQPVPRQTQQPQRPAQPQSQPQPLPVPAQLSRQESTPKPAAIQPSFDYSAQLNKQMEALEAAKRARAKAIQDARNKATQHIDAYANAYNKLRPQAQALAYTGNFRGDLVVQLKSTYGLRQAFVINEILKEPLGLREGVSHH